MGSNPITRSNFVRHPNGRTWVSKTRREGSLPSWRAINSVFSDALWPKWKWHTPHKGDYVGSIPTGATSTGCRPIGLGTCLLSRHCWVRFPGIPPTTELSYKGLIPLTLNQDDVSSNLTGSTNKLPVYSSGRRERFCKPIAKAHQRFESCQARQNCRCITTVIKHDMRSLPSNFSSLHIDILFFISILARHDSPNRTIHCHQRKPFATPLMAWDQRCSEQCQTS